MSQHPPTPPAARGFVPPTPESALEGIGRTEALAHELANILDGSMRARPGRACDLGPGLETDRLDHARRQIETVQQALARMSPSSARRCDPPARSDPPRRASDPLTLLQSIRHAVQVSLPRAGSLGARITLDLDHECSDLPAGAIYSVVLNAITNALDSIEQRTAAGGPPGGLVEISGHRLATGGAASLVQIDIIDDGAGPPKDTHRAFEHGFTTRPNGSGIGLSIARSIVDRAGGRIALDPRKDAPGARLRIVWPARQPASPAAGRSNGA